jgi:hypothetical protein
MKTRGHSAKIRAAFPYYSSSWSKEWLLNFLARFYILMAVTVTQSYRMWHRVVWYIGTNISGEPAAYIFRIDP